MFNFLMIYIICLCIGLPLLKVTLQPGPQLQYPIKISILNKSQNILFCRKNRNGRKPYRINFSSPINLIAASCTENRVRNTSFFPILIAGITLQLYCYQLDAKTEQGIRSVRK